MWKRYQSVPVPWLRTLSPPTSSSHPISGTRYPPLPVQHPHPSVLSCHNGIESHPQLGQTWMKWSFVVRKTVQRRKGSRHSPKRKGRKRRNRRKKQGRPREKAALWQSCDDGRHRQLRLPPSWQRLLCQEAQAFCTAVGEVRD